MPRVLHAIACAALFSGMLLLAGCGANGAPEPPEGYQPRPDKDFVLDPVIRADETKKR